MKTVRIAALLGAAMFVFGGAAQAADVSAEPAAVDWSGFYAGLHGGWGWADASASYNSSFADENCYEKNNFWPGGCAVDLDPNGGLVGAQAGFNVVLDNGLLLGIEGDFDFSSLHDDGQAGNPNFFGTNFRTSVDQDVDKMASVRGRVGVAMGNFLPFVTAGWGWAHGERSAIGNFVDDSDAQWHDGWVAGVGAEYAIDDRWSVKAEYRYYDLSKEDYMNNIFTDGTKVDLNIQTIQFGVNFHL